MPATAAGTPEYAALHHGAAVTPGRTQRAEQDGHGQPGCRPGPQHHACQQVGPGQTELWSWFIIHN